MKPLTYEEFKARMAPQLRTFNTGSVRTSDADETRYDLISEIGLERLARTCAYGAGKYGDHNWRKGQPFSVVLNHVLYHLNKFKQGDTSEDHLAHAAWGLFALLEFGVTRPELNDLYAYQQKEVQGHPATACSLNRLQDTPTPDKAHIAHQ